MSIWLLLYVIAANVVLVALFVFYLWYGWQHRNDWSP